MLIFHYQISDDHDHDRCFFEYEKTTFLHPPQPYAMGKRKSDPEALLGTTRAVGAATNRSPYRRLDPSEEHARALTPSAKTADDAHHDEIENETVKHDASSASSRGSDCGGTWSRRRPYRTPTARAWPPPASRPQGR